MAKKQPWLSIVVLILVILVILTVVYGYISYVQSIETFEVQEDVGCIVTRCVRKASQNTLYKECYEAIRRFHPELKIIFIDDNSNKDVLEEYPMSNVEIIQSEYPGAGEYLPYWYLLQRKMFKKAIFLQDSMILNTRIPYEKVDDYKFIYEFTADRSESNEAIALISASSKPKEMRDLYDSNEWAGCWGSTMVITSEFLQEVEDTLEISRWSKVINNRNMRMGLERGIALACIFTKGNTENFSLYGNINTMQTVKDPELHNKHNLEMYLADKTRIKDPIIKIWNGR
jgi:hypothetical protein